MKRIFFIFFSIFFLQACQKQSSVNPDKDWVEVSQRFHYKEDKSMLNVRLDTQKYTFKKSELPLKKMVFLNTSLLAYVEELGLEDQILGVSSPEYVYSPSIKKRISEGKIQNVGNEQKFEIEKIIQIKPDVVFSNYVQNFESTYEILRQNGIKVVFVDEYLEPSPLGKTSYLLLFGKLLGKEDMARQKIKSISDEYTKWKNLASKQPTKPVVISSEMYGGFWYMPGGSSNIAQFLKDANAHYIETSNETKTIPYSFEEVYAKASEATFWVNAGNHTSKKDLLLSNPLYKRMNVFNKGKIYSVIGREEGMANDFYQSGQVRADLVLKDYIKIFYPTLLPNYKLYYMKEIF